MKRSSSYLEVRGAVEPGVLLAVRQAEETLLSIKHTGVKRAESKCVANKKGKRITFREEMFKGSVLGTLLFIFMLSLGYP